MDLAPMGPHRDAAMAAIVRGAPKELGLDIPGPWCFDEALDHFVAWPGRIPPSTPPWTDSI